MCLIFRMQMRGQRGLFYPIHTVHLTSPSPSNGGGGKKGRHGPKEKVETGWDSQPSSVLKNFCQICLFFVSGVLELVPVQVATTAQVSNPSLAPE